MWVKRDEWEDLNRRVAELEGRPGMTIYAVDGEFVEDGEVDQYTIFDRVPAREILVQIARHLGMKTEVPPPTQRKFEFKKK